MHQALYRKWRPQRFEDVCGQEHITSILQYEIAHGACNHAYLFCGSRGTGKTTCAKILAKAVNCENPIGGSPCGECAACRSIDAGSATDVLEIDAASNNGVDNIRDIRDEVVYSPSALKYRVYIVDEVHMLSVSAFNALLKTLEEPPSHVLFILATTELHKLPATIISRCQRFEFRRIAIPVLQQRLLHIAAEEGIELDPEAARLLGKQAQGGMRDAISLLELCAGSRKPITVELVNEIVGVSGREDMVRIVRAIADRSYDVLLDEIAAVVASARDMTVFWQDLIAFYRDMMIFKTTAAASKYLDLTDSEQEQLAAVAATFTKEQLLYHSKLLDEALFAMQRANVLKRSVAEMTLIRMCDESLDTSPEALLSRVSRLEMSLSSGVTVVSTPAVVQAVPAEEAPKKAVAPLSQPTEEKPSKAKAAPAAEKPAADGRRVLKNLRAWVEIVDRMSELDVGAASFLRQARAYRDEAGKIIVRVDTEFSRMLLAQDGVQSNLYRTVGAVLKTPIPQGGIVLEVKPKKTDEGDLILDELDEI